MRYKDQIIKKDEVWGYYWIKADGSESLPMSLRNIQRHIDAILEVNWMVTRK